MILHKTTSLAIAIALANIAAPALAGIPHKTEMTCPVGGEEFTHNGTTSYSTYGSRPDGKPYGSWTFPIAIPECPDNGLVMYREFDDSEIDALTTLVLSDDYRALQSEPTYYRAQWLYDRLDGGEENPPWLLMRAIWQVDHDPSRKARYQGQFVARAGKFAVDPDNYESLLLRYRLANAWRELGEFERATTALDSIPLDALEVEAADSDDADYLKVRENRNRRNMIDAIASMRALIHQGNADAEPLTMIPKRIAFSRCADLLDHAQGPIDPFCTADENKEAIAEMRGE